MKHDPYCPATSGRYIRGTGLIDNDCQCALITKVRADERDIATSVAAEMLNEMFDNLRAQVKALPKFRFLSNSGKVQWVRRKQVLALLDD